MRIGDLRPPVMLLRRALRVKGFEGWPDLAVPLCQDQVRHQGQQVLVELEG